MRTSTWRWTQAHHRVVTAPAATVTLERTDGHPGGSKTYTTEMAHQAGLDKPSKTGVPSKWTLDPEPMCIARASSRVLKAHAADLVSGITFAEDVIDEPMIEIGGGSPVEALQATTEAVAAIEAPEPAPEPVKKASKPALRPPRPLDPETQPEDAEIVPDETVRAGRYEAPPPGHPRQRRRQQRPARCAA